MDCVQLRGLPYSASKHQILEFFHSLTLGEGGIHFIFDNTARPTGNAYVHFATVDDAIKATEKHKHHMGNRYIEVFRCPRIEMINAVGPFRFNIQQQQHQQQPQTPTQPTSPWAPSVTLANGAAITPDMLTSSGLFPTNPGTFSPLVLPPTPGLSWEPTPSELNNSAYALDQATQSLLKSQQSWPRMSTYSPSTTDHISAAFASPNKVKADPMSLLSPRGANPSTDTSPVNDLNDFLRSFSQMNVNERKSPLSLTSEQIADNLFSSLSGTLFGSDQFLLPSETEQSKPSWSDGFQMAHAATVLPNSNQQKTVVRMRGIPYNTDKFEILNFFAGYSLDENDVYICYNEELKPTGEAYVQFGTADEAHRAVLEKDRKHIGPRYVELFIDR